MICLLDSKVGGRGSLEGFGEAFPYQRKSVPQGHGIDGAVTTKLAHLILENSGLSQLRPHHFITQIIS